VLGLASVGNAQWLALKWVAGGAANDWQDPLNWMWCEIDDTDPGGDMEFYLRPTDPGDGLPWGNQVPTGADELLIDPPEANLGTHPIVGIHGPSEVAVCAGIQTIETGNPNMEQIAGYLQVNDWVWWGDWDNSIGDWYMNGGTMWCGDEMELGWHNGGGILWQNGGSMKTGRLIIPTGSGAMGIHFLNDGHYRSYKDQRFSMSPVGLMDISDGLLHIGDLDGSEVAVVQSYVDAGQIIGYGGTGYIKIKHFPATKDSWAHTNVWAEPIPEPATLSLLASLLVLGGVAWFYRRR
jgi:hypothetical protein